MRLIYVMEETYVMYVLYVMCEHVCFWLYIFRPASASSAPLRSPFCGAEEEVEGFQKEAEIQHEGVDDRSLDRGAAEVVRLEDGVAGKGEAEEEEGGYGTDCRQVQHC